MSIRDELIKERNESLSNLIEITEKVTSAVSEYYMDTSKESDETILRACHALAQASACVSELALRCIPKKDLERLHRLAFKETVRTCNMIIETINMKSFASEDTEDEEEDAIDEEGIAKFVKMYDLDAEDERVLRKIIESKGFANLDEEESRILFKIAPKVGL